MGGGGRWWRGYRGVPGGGLVVVVVFGAAVRAQMNTDLALTFSPFFLLFFFLFSSFFSSFLNTFPLSGIKRKISFLEFSFSCLFCLFV